jgi:Zn-dependent M32 family carboxypeptidase
MDIGNKLDGLDLRNMPAPKLDMSYSVQQAEEISREISKSNRERWNREEAKLEAAQRTADNTDEMKADLKDVIHNQNELIAYQRKQLDVLKMLFDSGEDGVEVQKEIMQHIIDAENDEHPVRDYITDKGGDVGVAALTASAPVIWAGIKTWLASKGVSFP